MSDEILLSESNFERVWMDADWNVRLEYTEAGQAYLDVRAARKKATRNKKRVAVVVTPYLVAAAAVAWKVIR